MLQGFLAAANRAYVAKTRNKLRSLSRSSRGWWKIAGSLLTNFATTENIPALQREDGSWAMSPDDKACELAKVFLDKAQLRHLEESSYSNIEEFSGEKMTGFLRIRVREVSSLRSWMCIPALAQAACCVGSSRQCARRSRYQ